MSKGRFTETIMNRVQEKSKHCIDRGTYKEDYPWSQQQLPQRIKHIAGDCGYAYVTVRSSCKLDFYMYRDNLVVNNIYKIKIPDGDPDKFCRFRFV